MSNGDQLLDIPRKKDPLEFLKAVMNCRGAKVSDRIKAAHALAAYMHTKRGENGKKAERATAAEEAARGLYAPGRAPKFVTIPGGKKAG